MKLEHLLPVEPPTIIRELVERYQNHHDSYLDPKFNEANLRQQFLNPFFKALGWDIYNERGDAEAYKDVVHEDLVRVGGTTKAPDYSFRFGGVRKFFVEAKKPSVDIENNPEPAYQLRRYAWSAKCLLSILTNFESLAVYDCRPKPDSSEKASIARVMLFRYQDYLDPLKWGQIAGVFHREVIPKGVFEAFAESNRLKKGTAAVDQEFLREIESWRDLLAHNIALRNPNLSQRELNLSVQTTIDRIIFLRICEDRGIEPSNTLKEIGKNNQVYHHLFERFQRADERYNSGLFHFHKETDRTQPPDILTPRLAIDDKPLREILSRLYYPVSPYEFSVISAEILGQVYEQFLGKVIRLTQGHRAVVEEKPEVRKAGGVYYTPAYIVDYIIKETLGSLIEGKSPMEVGGLTDTGGLSKTRRPVTVLDPACGSGSFLLEAYQFLLDWYLQWYVNDGPEKWTKGKEPKIHPTGSTLARRNGTPPGWRLTTSERKRILLAHIYGVDIDPQAVEVTKLSLLLKVLEGESAETLETQQRLLHERALPDLETNIKCGNSLVGPDYFNDRRQKNMFDEEEIYRINAFDWNREFGAIMKAGGFDAVVGNPPWGAEVTEDLKPYLSDNYSLNSGKYESYIFFVEKAASLLANIGIWGFIIPSYWVSRTQTVKLHKHLFGTLWPRSLLILPENVFYGVKMDACIIVASYTRRETVSIAEVNQNQLLEISNGKDLENLCRTVSLKTWEKCPRLRFNPRIHNRDATILAHIEKNVVELDNIVEITQGLTLYRRSTLSEMFGKKKSEEIVKNRLFHSSTKKDASFKKELLGRDVGRYTVSWNGKSWVSYGPWLAHAVDERFFKGPRLVVQKLRNPVLRQRLVAGYLEDDETYSAGVLLNLILRPSHRYQLFFVLGLLNSQLLNYWFRKSILDVSIRVVDLRKLPIRPIDFSIKAEKARHDKMVSLVTHMLSLHQRIDIARTSHEQDALQRQIEATDREIDLLTYELYGLNQEEIRIVEEEG